MTAGMDREKSESGGPLPRCAGVILAGGRSRRMGGGTKALLDLGGKPLLQHVIDRLVPQVGQPILSVETALPEFEPFGLPQVPDPEPGSNGPLGGLAAVLGVTAGGGDEWLLLVPCDAPFLPRDLAERLHRLARAENTATAVVSYGGRLQPAFSLWHRSMLHDLDRAVTGKQMGGFKQFLTGRRYSLLDWPTETINPFFNINDRVALDEACKMMPTFKGMTT